MCNSSISHWPFRLKVMKPTKGRNGDREIKKKKAREKRQTDRQIAYGSFTKISHYLVRSFFSFHSLPYPCLIFLQSLVFILLPPFVYCLYRSAANKQLFWLTDPTHNKKKLPIASAGGIFHYLYPFLFSLFGHSVIRIDPVR